MCTYCPGKVSKVFTWLTILVSNLQWTLDQNFWKFSQHLNPDFSTALEELTVHTNSTSTCSLYGHCLCIWLTYGGQFCQQPTSIGWNNFNPAPSCQEKTFESQISFLYQSPGHFLDFQGWGIHIPVSSWSRRNDTAPSTSASQMTPGAIQYSMNYYSINSSPAWTLFNFTYPNQFITRVIQL